MNREQHERFNQLMQAIGTDTRTIEMVTTPARLFILISHLQLALRHPANNGSSSHLVREIAENMAEVVCKFHPGARELIDQGWDSQYDMTREEFNEFDEPSRLPFVNQDDPNKPGIDDQF